MLGSNSLFLQLAIVLGLATAVGYGIKMLRLPLIVAYLVAGVVLSLFQFFDIANSQALMLLPQIGITFVLFFVGMELDLGEIKSLGKAIAVASLGQITIAFLTGFLIAQFLGFPQTESLYLGIGLSFSSTIVVVKLLLERRDLSSLYGKLSLGILLVEDLVAILILMGMSMGNVFVGFNIQTLIPILLLLLKGAALLVLALGLSRYFLAAIFNAAGKSAELMFLSALAWCFIFVAVSILFGFSVVIGAFLAGVALANSPFHFEIQGKVKPLRDFFVTLFFVYLGSQVIFEELPKVLPLIGLFVFYALILKPLVFLLILGSFGFRKHTIFQTALNLSQISEFSLIILMVGTQIGVVPREALTAMALTGVISIIVSSIVISSSSSLYPKMVKFVSFFERKNLNKEPENNKNKEMEDHVILIGGRWMGREVIKFLKRETIPFLVVDIDPKVVHQLSSERINVLYGDISDPEILDFLDLEKAKLIISTAESDEDNLILLSELKSRKAKATAIIRAATTEEAENLYKAGASYVLLPEIVSGDFVTQILKNHWPRMDYFEGRSEVELKKLSKTHLGFE